MRQIKARFTVVAVLGTIALWACSAPPPSSGSTTSETKSDKEKTSSSSSSSSGGSSSDKDSPSKTTSSSSGGNETDTDPTDPTTPGVCSASQGEDACYDCCEDKSPAGSDAMEAIDEAWMTCACAATACATQCAQTECNEDSDAEAQDGDACSTCLENLPCDDQWETACEANAECAALDACEVGCEGDEVDDEEDDGGDEEDFQARAGAKHQIRTEHAAKHVKVAPLGHAKTAAQIKARHERIVKIHDQIREARQQRAAR